MGRARRLDDAPERARATTDSAPMVRSSARWASAPDSRTRTPRRSSAVVDAPTDATRVPGATSFTPAARTDAHPASTSETIPPPTRAGRRGRRTALRPHEHLRAGRRRPSASWTSRARRLAVLVGRRRRGPGTTTTTRGNPWLSRAPRRWAASTTPRARARWPAARGSEHAERAWEAAERVRASLLVCWPGLLGSSDRRTGRAYLPAVEVVNGGRLRSGAVSAPTDAAPGGHAEGELGGRRA